MYKGLTNAAKNVVNSLAQSEASKCKAHEIHPEHIMLAILQEGSGTACRILRALNIDIDAMHDAITKKMLTKHKDELIGTLNYSIRGKKILEDAIEESNITGSVYVGTEHLLLTCAHEMDSITAKYLFKCNVSMSILRDMIRKIVSQGGEARSVVMSGDGKRHRMKRMPKNEHAYVAQHVKKRTPALDEFSTELTKEAQANKIDSFIGREKELARIVQILMRRNKNNPILIGEPGVGKTAIIEGLSHMIISGKTPFSLSNKRVLSVDLPAVVAGTKYRGEFEERLKRLMKEARVDKNIILFIDEIHTLVGAGGAEGSLDAANIFKPALSRGDIQCIGATTIAEYKKYIEKDPALERRFQSVLVEEPTIHETVGILHGIKKHYEQYHGVKYSDEAIHAAVNYSERYINERFLPDKAIDVIDEVGARYQIVHIDPPRAITEIQEEISNLNSEKIGYVNAQNYERAALLRDSIHKLETALAAEKEKWQSNLHGEKNCIYARDVMEVISDISRIPISDIAEGEIKKLVNMREMLGKQVVGQSEAIDIVVATIQKSKVGLHSPHKPIGSFLFLGPTGVGKTLLAKELSHFIFGSHASLIRIDMSDYMEKHTISRLVGAPPGYVGFQDGGELTEKVRRKPYSIILFDEVEKAHKDFFNILLQVLEEGELQDSLGHTVSFRNTIIIMTSNIGTHAHPRNGAVGFTEKGSDIEYEELQKETLSEVKKQFRPEFINRIDSSVVFKPLGRGVLTTIFDLLFKETSQRVNKKNITLRIQKSVKNFIIDSVQRDNLGARPLRRSISLYIEEPLSLGIINGSYQAGDTVHIRKKNNAVIVEKAKSAPHTVPRIAPVTNTEQVKKRNTHTKNNSQLGGDIHAGGTQAMPMHITNNENTNTT